MTDVSDMDLGRRARRLRVDTLVRLRWLAVAGQSIAVVVTAFVLGFPLPVGLCFLLIAVSAWLNIGLRLRYTVSHRLDDGAALALLAFDILQLAGLLFLSGGLANPFSVLVLAPIIISAVSLPWQRTAWLVLLMIAATSMLVFAHMALPWFPGQTLDLPFLYVVAIWIGIVLGACFVAFYASRVAEEARQLSDALAATELILAREQHLTQLDGLAAAAAHELGTPLATIALVVKEMENLAPKDGLLADDLQLLAQEVRRSRNILSKIASLDKEGAGMIDNLTLGHLIEDVVRPHRNFGVEIKVALVGAAPEPSCRRNPGVLFGLGNLVENAIGFATSEVRVTGEWSAETVAICIEDNGPGFAADVVNRIGEPYVTSRGGSRRAQSAEDSGLGLGMFIAKTLLERSGASLTFGNLSDPSTGARVLVAWPRAAFQRRPKEATSGGAPLRDDAALAREKGDIHV